MATIGKNRMLLWAAGLVFAAAYGQSYALAQTAWAARAPAVGTGLAVACTIFLARRYAHVLRGVGAGLLLGMASAAGTMMAMAPPAAGALPERLLVATSMAATINMIFAARLLPRWRGGGREGDSSEFGHPGSDETRNSKSETRNKKRNGKRQNSKGNTLVISTFFGLRADP